MTSEIQDCEIEEVRTFLEQEEANERLQPTSAEAWLVHAIGNSEQLGEDVAALVRAGFHRATLLRNLRELRELSGATGSDKLTGVIARRMKALAAELEANVLILPWEISDLASLLINGATAIARYNQRSERRQHLMASLTRRVDQQIRPRGGVGKKAQRAILARLFDWATETRRSLHAQRVATSRLTKNTRHPTALKISKPSDKRARGGDWRDVPACEAADYRQQGQRVGRRLSR
jgi:hypothetical protein